MKKPRVPLADTPIRDLELSLERSRFAPLLRALDRELEAVGISLKPRWYLSTEYGCLTRSTTIGLLWTDGFDRVQAMAKREGLRTRRGEVVLRTLRHESGHAFAYAHALYRTARYRRLFGVRGNFWKTYPDVWKPGAREKKRVARGEVAAIYATRHADEDFAVTFEVWLTHVAAREDWANVWAKKPRVLEKIRYVEEMARTHGRARPKVVTRPPLDEPLSELRQTVREWMRAVRAGTNYNLIAGGTGGT